MKATKIHEVTALYRSLFLEKGISKQRIDLDSKEHTPDELLAHAHYLLDGVDELARNPDKKGKTGRHLGSVQTILVVAGWFSLREVMDHNRPDK